MLRLIVMPTASNYVVSLKSAAPNALTCSIFKIPTLNITPTITQISAATIEAYKLASFKVLIEDDFILRLDDPAMVCCHQGCASAVARRF